MNNILLTLAALFLVAGCNSRVPFSIDNPTAAVLRLQIDQTTYDIGPHKSQDIALEAGAHSMQAPAIGKISFIVYTEHQGGLINPTLSDYVIVYEAYVKDQAKLKNFRPGGGGPFQLDGVKFNGPFELVNGLFIDKKWRFGVAEPFPDEVRGYDPGDGGNIYSKIFTAPEFISYFETRSGQAGYFEQYRQHQRALARTLAHPAPLPDFADPQMQQATLKLRDLHQRYLQATDAAEQKKLQDEHFKLSMDLTHFASPRLSALPAEDSARYSDFISLTSQAMSWSARVVPD